MSEVWDRVRRRLRAELGEDIYSSWFSRIEMVACDGAMAQLSVPTKFLKSWIQAHYLDRIVARFAEEMPGFTRITLNVRSADTPGARTIGVARTSAALAELTPRLAVIEKSSAPSDRAANDGVAHGESGLPANMLDRRMTFATFFAGKSNALAKAAAEKVADATEAASVYNPLYIHAGVGLGKTHLIQAVAHAASMQGRRVNYLIRRWFHVWFCRCAEVAQCDGLQGKAARH